MKILKEGKAHEAMAWFCTCEYCESELRIIEGDPMAGETLYNCDAGQYFVRYICPVCGSQEKAWTRSAFGVKANAERNLIKLGKEDREEMNGWAFKQEYFTDENVKFLTDRSRI